MTVFSRRWLLALLLSAPIAGALAQENTPLVVFGAASLTDTLQKIAGAYTQASGTPVKLSFASSSALAKQIESGARADLFVSADQEWMDYLDQKQLLKAGTRQDLLGNRLVLIAPQDSTTAVKLTANAPIAAALGANGRLATGDPDFVPVGKYAKAALTSLGIWETLEPRLARAENVRAALAYVARGEAPLGIVYATDAAVEPKVRIVARFAENSHPPIVYPVALTKDAQATAATFLQFLRSDVARNLFKAAGFSLIEASASSASSCDFQFDLSKELQLFAGQPPASAAAKSSAAAPALRADRLYEALIVNRSSFADAPAAMLGQNGCCVPPWILKRPERRLPV